MPIITNLLNWLKRQIRDQFGFTRAETQGVLILVVVILGLLTVPYGIQWYYTRAHVPSHDTDNALLDSTLALLKEQQITKKIAPPQPSHTNKLTSQVLKNQEKGNQDKTLLRFDINTATPQALQALGGIGPTRSARIVKYRDKLGGFVRQNQYQEVYGLDSLAIASIFQYTYIASDFQPIKININQDSFKTLLAHPYLSYEQVKHMVNYRNKKGSFQYVEELLQHDILTKDIFEKIKPYLAV